MEKINISGVQMCSDIEDKKSNFEKIIDMISNIDTDTIVLPETFNAGWVCEKFIANAETLNNSPTIDFLTKIAKEKKVNIIGGSFIRQEGKNYYNSCPAINRSGEVVAIYDKNHLYSYYGCNEGKYIQPGNNPVLVELDGIKYGISVCYDIRFPEIYRAYRKAGADILVNCAAWGLHKPIPWEIMTKSRAVENQTYMVTVNQIGEFNKNEFNLGHSRIIDYNGNVLSEMLEGEGVIQSDINLNDMYDFRNKCKILEDIKETYEVKYICEKS